MAVTTRSPGNTPPTAEGELRLHHSVQRAFSLIELLVVMGIVVLLLALMIPAVIGLSKSNNLNTGGRAVADVLAAARSEAITQRRLIQVRVATRWIGASGEDTSASYRKFSVWKRPQSDDTPQPTNSSDPYVQISRWETLPTGITFEGDPAAYNLPTATSDPRYPGTNVLDASLNNRRTNVSTGGATVDVAWIEFTPTGSVNFSGSLPGRVHFLVTEGFWNGSAVVSTNQHANWLAATVDTLVGRMNVLRP